MKRFVKSLLNRYFVNNMMPLIDERLVHQNQEIVSDIVGQVKDLLVKQTESLTRVPDLYLWGRNFKSFYPYKNKYKGEKVVLVGCGPTLENYTGQSDVIHIGVNRAYRKSGILLDFLFIQDQMPEDRFLHEVSMYRKDDCVKFFAILPPRTAEGCGMIPLSSVHESGAYEYLLSNSPDELPRDISLEPVGDLGGTAFSAFQFALYCGFNEIQLVGFDCSDNGHFEGGGVQSFEVEKQLNSWKVLRDEVSARWPSVRVTSLNPVGLRGVFEEVVL